MTAGHLPSDPLAVELLGRLAGVRIEVLRSEVTEEPDYSDHRLECRVAAEELPLLAFGLIYALGLMSFLEARPQGASRLEFQERDEWGVADMLRGLVFEAGELCFDADYVRGRMMKTRIRVRPDGSLLISTRNRRDAATRWIEGLQSGRPPVSADAADDVVH